MHTRSTIALLAMSSGLALSASAFAQIETIDRQDPVLRRAYARVHPGATDAPIGPDVIVGEIQASGGCCPNTEGVSISPSATVGGIVAYGLGTSSCNIGDANLAWVSSSPNHPIIPQNMYRLATVNGSTRLEQIGQSWSKYAFTALTYYVCGPNPLVSPSTCSGQGGSVLGIGCSDPYTSGRNATQSTAGPRYQCNPFTGVFPDDGGSVRAAWPATVDTTSRRLRVAATDLTTAGALYFGECQYVTKDDAWWGNSKNNASYRRFTVGAGNTITLQGAIGGVGTQRKKPAIFAWQANGGGVGVADPNVMITEATCGNTFVANGTGAPSGDGWYYLGSKATDLGGGTWHYEYAIENLNSDRGIGSFTVNFPAGAIVTNVEMKQMLCHSGVAAEDANRNAAWTQTVGATSVTWASPNTWSAATPTLGSYIRWGTMCNFRFDCNIAPVNTGTANVGYYKPLATYVDSLNVAAWVPGTSTPTPCYANCDGSTVAPILNSLDFSCFLTAFAQGQSYANCDNSTVPPVLNALDFSCFLTKFAAGCT